MSRFFIIAVMQLCVCALFAQQPQLRGKVIDSNNKKSIDLCYVCIDSTQIVSNTNENGVYTINHIKLGHHTLLVSRLGYASYKTNIIISQGVNIQNISLTSINDTISPVVVTGTGTQYKLQNVPVQTEIISKADIKKMSGRSLEDVLSSNLSSIDFTSSSMGTDLKLNGLGKDYLLILVNGKRLLGGNGGYTDFSRINTEDIEQIEVVKGASSTLYGSDAIAGVINIITKKTNRKFSVYNSTRKGAHGDLKQLNTISFNKNNFSGKTFLSIKQTDGWQLNKMKYNTQWKHNHNKPFLVRAYDMPINKSRGYTVGQSFNYKVSDKLSLNSDASWYEKTLYFPFKGKMHNYYYNNIGASIGAKYNINTNNFIDLNISYNRYKYYTQYPWKYNEQYTTADNGVIRKTYYPGDSFKNSDRSTAIANLKWVFKLNNKNTFNTGAEVYNEVLESKYRLTKSDVQAHTYALYTQDEFKWSKQFSLIAGVRGLYHNQFGFMATPKISLMYKKDKFTHRFTYANGFKSPTLKELYYYYESNRMGMYRLYLGNEDLKPQKSNYYSISTEFNTNKFKTNVNLYANLIHNMIDYKIIPTSYSAELRGVEETKLKYNINKAQSLGVDWHFTWILDSQFTVSGGYSYVDARNLKQDIRLNGVSANSATCKVTWKKYWKNYDLNINLFGNYKSDRFYLEEDTVKSYAKPYQLWKLTTNHHFTKIKNTDITLTLGLDNIFNYVDKSPYGAHYGTLNPGRTVFVGLNFRFSTANDKKKSLWKS